ncbi:MAG: VanZ family protein [Thermoanaerobaculia bacterium]|nr:VanZ family protein [Thermoanaerobaculia bacterium]
MSLFTSTRERRLWLLALGTLILIYSTLGLARTAVEVLRDNNLLRLSVALVMVASAAVVMWRIGRQRPGRREVAVVALAGAVYLAALVVMERAEERLHLLEYGLVAAFVFWALEERRANGAFGGRSWLWAILATAAAGWLDEGIQHILPSRYYDLKDVGLNAGGAILAVLTIEARAWARRRDRRAGKGVPAIEPPGEPPLSRG